MGHFKQILRNKLLFTVNIAGLSSGLAVSIMLMLFMFNELSFDKHFANSKQIVSLNTVLNKSTGVEHLPINLRRAYTEVPEKVTGINACTQIYRGWMVDVINNHVHFQGIKLLYVDPEFFKVFQLTFIEGSPKTALTNPKTLVITRPYANLIFGSPSAAFGKTITVNNVDYTIDAVVESLPSNTHFSFDLLGEITSHSFNNSNGLEFFTFYLIDKESSVRDVRFSIEQAYSEILSEQFTKWINAKYSGETEKLANIYLFSKADFGLSRQGNIQFVLLLGGLSFIILLLAITNFVNLFVAQGETRMREIGIRKVNGAGFSNIIRQFFSEVSLITLIAFVFGYILAVVFSPYFSKLIDHDIELKQIGSLWFILGMIVVFALTVILSASYPAFYLSRFKSLNVLVNRSVFGKRQLSTFVFIFQSAVTIALISYVLIVTQQTTYVKNLPIGYNPNNVMMVQTSLVSPSFYETVRQELRRYPQVKEVSAASHVIGGGCSGGIISMPHETENAQSIDEYQIMPGLCELMMIELVDGEFFKENDPNNATSVLLNKAAVSMLGIHPPYVGREVISKQRSTIIGVIKDFCYDEPGFKVMPLMLSCYRLDPVFIYIRFGEDVSRTEAIEITTNAFRKFDSEFIPNSIWSEDVYNQKFDAERTHAKIILFGSLLSIFIASLGLLAVQSFVTIRRTKEVGIRRVLGASKVSITALLTLGLIRGTIIAGIIAIPIAWWFSTRWLNNYADKTAVNWFIFAIPMIIQGIIIVFVISSVSYKILTTNPIELLQNE